MEEDYVIVPITKNCSSSSSMVHSISKTSGDYQQLNNSDSTSNQILQNQSLDTIQTPKPLVGGKINKTKNKTIQNNKFIILFYNKKYTIYALNEYKALSIFFKDKKYKKKHIVYINKNTYEIISNRKKNYFRPLKI